MRRSLPAIVGILAGGLLAAGCSTTLGRTMPECDTASATMVLAVQSVPGSDYVSCVNGLKAGWRYEDLLAESGKSTYSLDSDRMGSRFITVENLESCDIGDAIPSATDEPGVVLWKDVESRVKVEIVVVPEGSTMATSDPAVEVILQLRGQEVNGRPVVVVPATSDRSTSERIEDATARGAHIVVVTLRDTEEGTLTLLTAGGEEEIEVDSVEEVLEEIEDVEEEASYTGTWSYVFDGGCVVYTFDAQGPGVETISEDINTALSLFDAEALRQLARDAGYELP